MSPGSSYVPGLSSRGYELTVELIYKEIGLLLMARRHELGMTQEDVAEILGLTRTSIVNIECGRQRIMLHTIIGIAAILGEDSGQLLSRAIERVRARN